LEPPKPKELESATLIGMHRNPWWLTPEGPTLDSGSFVVGLEFSAGVRAVIAGKPCNDQHGNPWHAAVRKLENER
jgi:ribonucleotide monophosphatase NagD (HAD superfamily)